MRFVVSFLVVFLFLKYLLHYGKSLFLTVLFFSAPVVVAIVDVARFDDECV